VKNHNKQGFTVYGCWITNNNHHKKTLEERPRLAIEPDALADEILQLFSRINNKTNIIDRRFKCCCLWKAFQDIPGLTVYAARVGQLFRLLLRQNRSMRISQVEVENEWGIV
jgi:hypothetical protein